MCYIWCYKVCQKNNGGWFCENWYFIKYSSTSIMFAESGRIASSTAVTLVWMCSVDSKKNLVKFSVLRKWYDCMRQDMTTTQDVPTLTFGFWSVIVIKLNRTRQFRWWSCVKGTVLWYKLHLSIQKFSLFFFLIFCFKFSNLWSRTFDLLLWKNECAMDNSLMLKRQFNIIVTFGINVSFFCLRGQRFFCGMKCCGV